MPEMTVLAPAKINLSLAVTGRRADGYHLLSSVMQSIGLADRVSVRLDFAGRGISLALDQDGLPLDQRNTAFKAAALFLEAAGLEAAVHIAIEKHIPAAAGLAGGSADAAAVLFALDQLLPGSAAGPRLYELAARIGADVPFCLRGGTVLCQGIGDELTGLPPFADVPLLLCKPAFEISTTWVYQELDRSARTNGAQLDQAGVLAALASRDLAALSRASANVLETVSLPAYPLLARIKKTLAGLGADMVLMSGSGPTVFGLFADSGRRDRAAAALPGALDQPMWVACASTLASGPWAVYNDANGEPLA
jgi:4-diphosphocytidyl-2-C-methyl-D-erythritol kinase